MSEIVERVAKAIADNIQAALPSVYVHSIDYEYAARAALQAMREPTAGMVGVGESVRACAGVEELDSYGHPKEVWQVMLDEALK